MPGFTDVGGLAAFLVTGVDRGGDGGLLLSGRVIGCDHEGVGKELSSLVNWKGYRLHLCPASPCAGGSEDSLVHTVSVRWFEGAGFDAPYMRPWGRLVLKEYLEAPQDEEPEEPGKRERRKKRERGKGEGEL